MNRRVLARAVAAGMTSLGLLVGLAPVASAEIADFDESPVEASSHAIAAADRLDLIAVTGTNRRLYVRFSDEAGWTNLGGQLSSVPSIALGPDGAYFVGVGLDNNVWIRTFDKPWKRLGPSGTHCAAPSAVTSNGILTVGCQGSNGALYVGKVRLTAGQLPALTGWRNYGGKLKHGVSVWDDSVGDSPAFGYAVVGTNDLVYLRDDTTGFQGFPGLYCGASVEVSEYAESVACRDKASGGLRYWNAVTEAWGVLSGQVAGRPGVAVDPDAASRYYVVGTDRNIYVARQSADGAVTRFTRFGGAGLGGVVAVSLTP